MARKDKQRDRDDAPPADDGWGTYVHGTRPIAGEQARGTASPVLAGPSAAAQPGRGRTGLILLVSFAVQLVVVLAAGNTFVVRKALEFRNDHSDVLGAFATLPNVYAWRLTPASNDNFNAYPALLFGLLAVFVVAALLALALVRGPITFWRAFVAVFLATIVATLAGGMVRRAVLEDIGQYRPFDKATGVLFQGTGNEVVAGAITGLLAGLVAAIVAVASRRPAEAVVPLMAPDQAPYVEPAAPPPWHGDDVRSPALVPPVPAASAASSEPPPSFRKPQADDTQATDTQKTTQFGAAPPPTSAPGGDTTRLRREDAGQYGPPTVVGRDKDSSAETPAEPTDKKPADEKPADEKPAGDEQQTAAMPAVAPAVPPAVSPAVPPAVTPRPQPSAAGGVEQSTQALPAQTSPANQSTQAFPRPPDDEDLGHQPDDD